ncbi:hypothetical protein BJ165DRAFT_1408662 [Panaeolus papilionaceus]|nr:hypothetical protein BJ165DRAFT_1408662 [Panaeolus papilionaceus]
MGHLIYLAHHQNEDWRHVFFQVFSCMCRSQHYALIVAQCPRPGARRTRPAGAIYTPQQDDHHSGPTKDNKGLGASVANVKVILMLICSISSKNQASADRYDHPRPFGLRRKPDRFNNFTLTAYGAKDLYLTIWLIFCLADSIAPPHQRGIKPLESVIHGDIE